MVNHHIVNIQLILSVALSLILPYDSLKANSPDVELYVAVKDLFEKGQYEECSLFVLDHFISENEGEQNPLSILTGLKGRNAFYDDKGVFTSRAGQCLPSQSNVLCFKRPKTWEEALAYYFGAASFMNLASLAYRSVGEGTIFHFINQTLYSPVSIQLAYHYMAYIFADIALSFLDNIAEVSDTEWMNRYQETRRLYFSLLQTHHECMKIKVRFDLQYQDVLGSIYKLDWTLLNYTSIAGNPKKSVRHLKTEEKRIIQYALKNQEDIFTSDAERISFFMDYEDATPRRILKKYLPEMESILLSLSNDKGADDGLRAAALSQMKDNMNNAFRYLPYLSEKSYYNKYVSECINTYLAFDIAHTYVSKTNITTPIITDWIALDSLLQPGDLLVLPFYDKRFIMGLIIYGDKKNPTVDYLSALGEPIIDLNNRRDHTRVSRNIYYISSFLGDEIRIISTGDKTYHLQHLSDLLSSDSL